MFRGVHSDVSLWLSQTFNLKSTAIKVVSHEQRCHLRQYARHHTDCHGRSTRVLGLCISHAFKGCSPEATTACMLIIMT